MILSNSTVPVAFAGDGAVCSARACGAEGNAPIVAMSAVRAEVPNLLTAEQVSAVQEWLFAALQYKSALVGAASLELLPEILAEREDTSNGVWYVLALQGCGIEANYAPYLQLLSKEATAPDAAWLMKQKAALLYAIYGQTQDFYTGAEVALFSDCTIMNLIYELYLPMGKRAEACAELLARRLADGGFALYGLYADVDVTAMAAQALSVYMETEAKLSEEEVQELALVLEEAGELLESRQLNTGDYASWGTENAESTAQVLLAACAFGSQAGETADGVWISTLLTGLSRYRLADETVSHTVGGGANDMATAQTVAALAALLRLHNGEAFLLSSAAAHMTTGAPDAQLSENGGEPEASEGGDESETLKDEENETPENKGESEVQENEGKPEAPENKGESETLESSEGEGKAETPKDEENAETLKDEENAETPENGSDIDAPNADAAADSPKIERNALSRIPHYLIGVLVAVAALFLFLRARSRRLTKKTALITLLVVAAAAVLLWRTELLLPSEYYATVPEPQGETITITIGIRCDTVAGRASHIPADGCLLPEQTLTVQKGATVYEALLLAARANGLVVEAEGGSAAAETLAYIEGIQQLYEFDFGDLSGWLYTVNGVTPGVGCGFYVLAADDRVLWLYTCALGGDLDVYGIEEQTETAVPYQTEAKALRAFAGGMMTVYECKGGTATAYDCKGGAAAVYGCKGGTATAYDCEGGTLTAYGYKGGTAATYERKGGTAAAYGCKGGTLTAYERTSGMEGAYALP